MYNLEKKKRHNSLLNLRESAHRKRNGRACEHRVAHQCLETLEDNDKNELCFDNFLNQEAQLLFSKPCPKKDTFGSCSEWHEESRKKEKSISSLPEMATPHFFEV